MGNKEKMTRERLEAEIINFAVDVKNKAMEIDSDIDWFIALMDINKRGENVMKFIDAYARQYHADEMAKMEKRLTKNEAGDVRPW